VADGASEECLICPFSTIQGHLIVASESAGGVDVSDGLAVNTVRWSVVCLSEPFCSVG
jgi:hypothetical protein